MFIQPLARLCSFARPIVRQLPLQQLPLVVQRLRPGHGHALPALMVGKVYLEAVTENSIGWIVQLSLQQLPLVVHCARC